MPIPSPSRTPSGPPRRDLLAGVLAVGTAALLTGCSDGEPGRAERTSAARKLRERAARDSGSLLARYDATVEAHPALARRLRPLRAEVARHADAFGAPGGTASPSASATASPDSASPSAGRASAVRPHVAPDSALEVPKDEKEALSALAAAERRTADARADALVDAPPELARLLASVAAAGAAHAYLLSEGG